MPTGPENWLYYQSVYSITHQTSDAIDFLDSLPAPTDPASPQPQLQFKACLKTYVAELH